MLVHGLCTVRALVQYRWFWRPEGGRVGQIDGLMPGFDAGLMPGFDARLMPGFDARIDARIDAQRPD